MKKLLYFMICMAITTMAIAQIPTTGLQGLYQFESSLADSSGNGNDLTNLNNPTAISYVAGRNNVGEAVFTGANSLCGSLVSPSTMNFTGNQVTISFWAKLDGSASNNGRSLLTVLNGSNAAATYSVEYRNAGTPFIMFYAYHNTAYTSYTVITAYAQSFLNKWTFFTFTFSPTAGARMYADGAYWVDVAATSATVNSGSNAIRISHNNTNNCMTQTPLDEVAIYNRALTATEVTDLYYGLYDGPCNNTITATIPSTKKQCPASAMVIPITINNVYNPSFEWFKDGQPIANSNNDTLNLPASATNNGSYTVRITTSCDTLTVGPTEVAMVDANFVPVLTINGAQLTITPADGTGYNWYTDGVLLAGNSILSSITASNPGFYTAEIVYGAGAGGCTSVSSNGVSYCPPFYDVNANGFASGINSATVCEEPQNGGIIYSVTSGGSAQRTIQWYKDGQPISGATSANYIYNLTLSAAGTYTYRVASLCDTAFSIGYEVTVLPRPTVSITSSGSTLTATTLGSSYDWYYNGNQISGNTQSITAVGNGTYSVFVTDADGCVSLESAGFVYTASGCNNTISISGGALSGAFCESANLTLNMQPTINSGTNLSYQWYKDNVLIPGATSLRYDFPALVANNGTYSIKVTSNCDTVTYGNLVVDIVARLATPAITANGTTLSATTQAASYQWFLDGVLLTDNTQSVTASADGIYRVIAVGFCPSDTSAAYNYEANRVCSFTTTYTVGVGNCTTVTFDVDGAILPVTAFISYTGQQTPSTHIFDSVVNTLFDFCPSTYLVTLSDANGCTDTLNFTITEVGIGQVNSNISINLYPNPASHTLAISTSEILTGVEVYNVMGQQVVTIAGHVSQIDVTTLPAGTYYLNAKTAQGSVRKPFVKY